MPHWTDQCCHCRVNYSELNTPRKLFPCLKAHSPLKRMSHTLQRPFSRTSTSVSDQRVVAPSPLNASSIGTSPRLPRRRGLPTLKDLAPSNKLVKRSPSCQGGFSSGLFRMYFAFIRAAFSNSSFRLGDNIGDKVFSSSSLGRPRIWSFI